MSQTIIDRVVSYSWTEGTEILCVTAIPTLTQYFYDVQDSHEMDSLESARNQKVKANEERLHAIAKLLQSKLPHASVST